MMRYYLFYPSKITGGAEYLLYETALLLHRNGFCVSMIDIQGGWLSEKIKETIKDIELIYVSEDKKITLSNGILITPASLARKTSQYFNSSENVRVLLWIMSPYNVIRKLSIFKKINHLSLVKFIENVILYKDSTITRSFLEKCVHKKSIYSVDKECFDIFGETYAFKPNGYLPIILPERKFSPNFLEKKQDKNALKILWIGRIDLDSKFFALKKIIDDFSSMNNHELIVVGDGDGYKKIRNYAKSINIRWLGTLNEKCIKDVILSSDIGFGMGTSALEMAAKGLPTVLMDYSYCEFASNYKYCFISSAKKYSIGSEVCRIEDMKINRFSFSQIIDLAKEDSINISKKCYQYVNENYRTSNIETELIRCIQETELLLSDCILYCEQL